MKKIITIGIVSCIVLGGVIKGSISNEESVPNSLESEVTFGVTKHLTNLYENPHDSKEQMKATGEFWSETVISTMEDTQKGICYDNVSIDGLLCSLEDNHKSE